MFIVRAHVLSPAVTGHNLLHQIAALGVTCDYRATRATPKVAVSWYFYTTCLDSLPPLRHSVAWIANREENAKVEFHRNHVIRYLDAARVPDGAKAEILARVEDAIAEYSDKDAGIFRSGELSRVFSDESHVSEFMTKWSRGELST